jgi:isopropylmalate/homocitrate/citramalate synthase
LVIQDVNILDTTLREGELNPSVYYTIENLESIGLSLAKLGTPRIEFSIPYPQRGGSVSKLREVFSNIQSSYELSTLIVQCRALIQDIEIAQKLEVNGCGVYLAISEEHRINKLGGISIEEVIIRLTESLDILKEYGFHYRRAVLEDASRFFSSYRGNSDTLGDLGRIIKEVELAGATTISLPDSAGLLEENQVLEMFRFARKITKKELSAHFHNDYGNALGNTKSAVKESLAVEPHVSIYGLGAGAGIADHYELSANLMDNLNIETHEDRGFFHELYSTFQQITKIPIPWNHPLSDFARTEKAGTHQAQQLRSPEGYVPKKKLNHDFNNNIFFDVSRLMSKNLMKKLLQEYHVNDNSITDIINLISKRSVLLNRKLYNVEIKNIIKDITNINLPTALISQYVGPEKAFYLLRVTPQTTSEITEELEKIKGVIRVLETYGSYDIVVEAYTNSDMKKIIENTVGINGIEISPLIVG